MDTTILWLTRHAETATPNVVHGAESDVELGEHGRLQAAAAAGWFRDLSPTVVVTARSVADPSGGGTVGARRHPSGARPSVATKRSITSAIRRR